MKIFYFKNTFNPKDIKTYEHDNLKQWFLDMELDPSQYHIADRKGEVSIDCKSDIICVFPKIRGGHHNGKNIFAAVVGLALLLATGGTTAALFHGLGGLTMAHTLGAGLLLSGGGSLLMGKMKMPQISVDADSASNASYQWNVGALKTSRGIKGVTYGNNVIPEGELLSYRTYGTSDMGAIYEDYLISRAYKEKVTEQIPYTRTIRIGGKLITETKYKTVTKEITVPAKYGSRLAKYSVTKPNSWLELLIGCGEGPLTSINDIKINGIAISDLESSGATVETRLGTNDQSSLSSMIDNQIGYRSVSQALPIRLSESADYLTITTPVACDSFKVAFQASGFYLYDTASGSKNPAYASLSFEYRKQGSDTWQTANINSPLKSDAPILSDNPFYFTVTVTPFDGNGIYEIRLRNESAFLNNQKGLLSAAEYETLPDRAVLAINVDNVACYSVKDHAYPNTAYIFLKLPATQLLNGSIPEVTWKQSKPNIIVYNTNDSIYETKPADNLAWAIYDIFCQIRQDQFDNSYKTLGEDPTHVDFISFSNFADFCETINAKGNWFLNRQRTAWETAQGVATSARAYVGLRNGKIAPFWDAQGSMTQIFTSGNIIEGSINGGFISKADRATAIEATFNDENNEYKETTIRINADDYDDGSEGVKLTFAGLSTVSAVYSQARYLLRRNKYLTQTISFKAGIDSIVCELGDIIGVQSDITSWGAGGRVYSVTDNKIKLDTNVTLQSGNTYALVVRHSDGTIERKTPDETNGTYSELTFSNNPFSKAVLKGDVYSFGVSSYETKPFRVESISRDSDQVATIEAIEYNENVYTPGTAPTVNYSSVNAGINSLTSEVKDELINLTWEAPEAQYVDVYINGEFYGRCVDDSVSLPAMNGNYEIVVVPVAPDGTQGTPITKTINSSLSIPSQLNVPVLALSSSGYLFTFSNLPLDENIVWVIIKEGNEEKARTAVSGSTVSINMSLSGGSHTLTAIAVNKYGKESEPVTFNVSAPVIAGWTIGENKLYKDNIEINSDGEIKTADYENGLKGWDINGEGDAEFNDITARGKIKTAVFEYDKVSAVGGELLVRHGDVIKDVDSGPNPNIALNEYFNAVKQVLGNDSQYADATMETFTGDFAAYDAEIFSNTRNILYSELSKNLDRLYFNNQEALNYELWQFNKLNGAVLNENNELTSEIGNTFQAFNVIEQNKLNQLNGVLSSNYIYEPYLTEDYFTQAKALNIENERFEKLNGLFENSYEFLSENFTNSEDFNASELEQYTNLYDIIGAGNYTDTRGHLRELYQFNKLNDSTLNESNEFDSDLDNSYQTLLDTEQARGEDLNEILTESFDVETSMYKTPYSEYEASEGGGNKYYVTSNAYFNIGDIIRIKNGVSEDMWLTVSETGNDEKGEYVKGSLIHGDEFTPTSGQTIVNYGSSGSGGILLDGNKPTVDLFNHSGEPWNPTLLMRLGNLNGSYNETTDKYGIAIGNANGQYLKYTPDGGLYIKGNIYADGGDISGASGTFGAGANAIIIDSNGISSTNFSVNASTGAVTANNITATGGTYTNITANNVTANGGTYSNITANNLTANNVTANGGTYNSITANNINISNSSAEAMQIGNTCYDPDNNSISIGTFPHSQETASVWLYLGNVTGSPRVWTDQFSCKTFKIRVFNSLILLTAIFNGLNLSQANYILLAGDSIETALSDYAKIYYVETSVTSRKIYLKFPSVTAMGAIVEVLEAPSNNIQLTKTAPTNAVFMSNVSLSGFDPAIILNSLIAQQVFHTAANSAGAEDGCIKLINNFVIQYGKAIVNASSGETSCSIRVTFPIKMASATPCVFCAPVTRDGSPLGWLNISSDTYNNGITVSQTGVTIQANCYNGNTRIYWFYWLCLGIAATS